MRWEEMKKEGWVTTLAGTKFPLFDWLYHHKDVNPGYVGKKLGEDFFSNEDDAVKFYYRKGKAQGEK
jgi:hypothetical protein